MKPKDEGSWRYKGTYLIVTSILTLILAICLLLISTPVSSSPTISSCFSILNPQDDKEIFS